ESGRRVPALWSTKHAFRHGNFSSLIDNPSQNIAGKILVLHDLRQHFLHVCCINGDRPLLHIRRVEVDSSSTRSMMVCRRLAPMFSVDSFTRNAKLAISSSASRVNSNLSPSVSSSAVYCFTRDDFGSVRIAMKSVIVSDFSSTRMGKRP